MTLNLSQMRQQIKSATLSRASLNLTTGSGQAAAYRALKSMGWTCGQGDGVNLEKHPTDRVPVFRLNGAALRRDKSDRTGWILEIGQAVYTVKTGTLEDLAELTERAAAMAAEETPASVASDAARIVADLLAQHPQLDGWAQRGLALVENGEFDAGKYDTRIVPETAVYECDCPARAPRLNLENKLQIATYLNGKACKHAIALYIQTVLDHETETVAYRERFDRVERRAGHTYDTAPGDGGVSDQDLAAPLPAQTWRMNLQTALVAKDHKRAGEMIETMRACLPRLNGKSRGYQQVIDWAEKWMQRDRAYNAALKPDRLNTKGRQRDYQHTGHRYG